MIVLHEEARYVGIAWMIVGLTAYLIYRRRIGLDPRHIHRRGLE